MRARDSVSGAVMFLALCLFAPFAARAQSAAAPPSAPGMARVWLLRQYEPYRSLAQPTLYINGAPFAVSLPGTAFYRDLPPGNYVFGVASEGWDYNQQQPLQLLPGVQAFLDVLVDPNWDTGRFYQRDTFYVRLILPERAAQEMTQLRYLGGG